MGRPVDPDGIRIDGDRILLRPPREEDIDDLYQHARDPGLRQYMRDFPDPYRREHAEEFVERVRIQMAQGERLTFGIILQEAERPLIGVIGVSDLDLEHDRNGSVGYWVAKPYWRQGFATEALDLVLEFCFTELDLVRVWARVLEPNTASAELLEKVGFKREGRLRNHLYHEGDWVDDLRYGLLRNEYVPDA